MSLTVDQINNKQFNTKMRGYNPEEVQEFIQEVSQTVQQLITENNNLQEQVRANDSKIKYFADLKDSLNKSILVAQEAADKVKNNAKREADIMIREAQKQATDIVSEANDKSNQVIEDAANSTKKLTSETNDLRKQTRIFRQRLQVMLESQLEVIKSNEWDKLLENDENIAGQVTEELKKRVGEVAEKAYGSGADLEAAVADQRYQYIAKVVKDAVKKGTTGHVETKSDKLDKILTNRILALPIFAVVMYLLFACTNSENFLFLGINSPGIWLAGNVESIWGWLTDLVAGLVGGASPWVYSLVVDGIMEGLGAILGFIPLVLVLYILISFLEDCGYMARIAFVLDRIFRRFGLSGRSFIPLLQGFGCSVPAVMATRTLESEKDRKITTILAGFMPCGAKLPIFALFVSTLFVDSNQTLVTYSLYIFSIVVAIIVSLLLNKFVYKDGASNFIMELPQYRIPTLKSILIHGWEKVKGFAVKAGTVIFVSTILIWFLSGFNFDSFNGTNAAESEDGSVMCEMNDSFMASIGNVIAPIFKPLGFGEWRPAVGVVTGWIAKENVVVTFAQLYDEDVTDEYLEEYFAQYSSEELEELGFEDGEYDAEAAGDIYSEGVLFEGGDENALPHMKDDIKTKAAAYAYMVFNLLCMPCFAAVGAMKRELKTWKETGKAVAVQMVTAYVVALLVNVVGGLFL